MAPPAQSALPAARPDQYKDAAADTAPAKAPAYSPRCESTRRPDNRAPAAPPPCPLLPALRLSIPQCAAWRSNSPAQSAANSSAAPPQTYPPPPPQAAPISTPPPA